MMQLSQQTAQATPSGKAPISLLTKSEKNYAKTLRDAARGLWGGQFNFASFVVAMNSAIDRGLTQAWHEGAREAGIQPNELTAREIATLQGLKSREFSFVFGFADYILANDKASGGKLGKILARIPLWVNRYLQIKERARMMAGTDKKYIWVRDARDSCKSCIKLDGKVKRLSLWKSNDIHPKHPNLECMQSAHGVAVCRCSLEETNLPLTRGRLPRIP